MCPQVILKAESMFRFPQEINPFTIVLMDLYCLMPPSSTSLPHQRTRSQNLCSLCLLATFALMNSAYPTLCICSEAFNQPTSPLLPPPNH